MENLQEQLEKCNNEMLERRLDGWTNEQLLPICREFQNILVRIQEFNNRETDNSMWDDRRDVTICNRVLPDNNPL